ncbi:MAG: hypothetical protein KatS3mg052_2617 [Candidatus Roseilinea sp.]|nr:MAG: hypothetical protein KatS3mg052_2617 [Candidatus Roseilinea sp.]
MAWRARSCLARSRDLIVVQETDKPFLDRYEGILAEIHTANRRPKRR